jgi:glutathione S-transferase
MAMILYDYTMAPNPRRARIFLAEKGAEVEKVQIDLAKREQLTPEYRAINPLCTLPALKLEDGTLITENTAIAAYLEAAYPNPPLLGTTPLEKAFVALWNARAEFEGLAAAGEALRNSAPAMQDRALTGPENFAQVPDIVPRGIKRLEMFLDTLEARLEGRDYLAIDTVSMADITALVTVDFARVVRVRPQERHVNVARWRAALLARPSFSA